MGLQNASNAALVQDGSDAALPLLVPALVTVTAAVGPTLPMGAVSDNPYAIAPLYAPSDSLFGRQWHLNNTGQSGGTVGVDLNLLTIWEEFTGRGVTVGIWDDGVQYTHPDLDGNYNAALNILNANGSTHDALPLDSKMSHGTSVAGVIAAENNGTGTVGVAFNAKITGVNNKNQVVGFSQSMEQLDRFDVTNHSYEFGPQPFYNNFLDPDLNLQTFHRGIRESVEVGRGGLGTINLVAAGNFRIDGKDSNDSNFTNVPQTISVAAVGHDGRVAFDSTPGAANLVGGPSSGPTGSGIWTTDLTGADGYSNGANEPGNTNADYTSRFGGTSSATPAVTGVVALMLEANPLLGWRDVQDILAMSARHTGSAFGGPLEGSELYNWAFNGATNWNAGGMHFSNDYGFGLVDAFAAVRLAETWTERDTSANWANAIVSNQAGGSTVIPDNTPAGRGFAITVTDTTELEHVGLTVRFDDASVTGDYLITLTSPSGTVSYLSRVQNRGDALNGDFFLMSNAFRGESGVGKWTVTVADGRAGNTGTLEGLTLQFYGNAASTDDIYVFTDEYSKLVDLDFGHRFGVQDSNGGTDTFNLSALTSNSIIVLGDGGRIDGVTLGSFEGEPAEITGIENVIGGDGNDRFTGDSFANSLSGMRGKDTLSGGGGNDSQAGGAGDDLLSGGVGNDTLNGGRGNDTMVGGSDNDVYVVDTASDRVFETTTTASLIDAGGIDRVDSSVSFTLDASAGVRFVERMTLTGTANINATGNALANVLTGNAGNNRLIGGLGNDTMLGGAGNDVYVVDTASDRVFETTTTASLIDAGGTDTVQSAVNFNLDANAGVRFVERLTLTGTGNTTGTGNGLGNLITGNSGNNLLNGGLGKDTLLGGAGNDTFVFNTAPSATNIDRIDDFDVIADTIRLENAVFAGLANGTLSVSAFASNATGVATDALDRVIYATDTGRLYFDADGDGVASRVHFATLTAIPALTNSDFFVI